VSWFGDHAARKALLVAQADLSRLKIALAWRDLRRSVAPPAPEDRSERARRIAGYLVRYFAPLLGRSRFGRTIRVASLAWSAMRFWRGWRAGAR
jgi:hypothetical protein